MPLSSHAGPCCVIGSAPSAVICEECCSGTWHSLALSDADTVTCVGWANNKDLFSVRFVGACACMRACVYSVTSLQRTPGTPV